MFRPRWTRAAFRPAPPRLRPFHPTPRRSPPRACRRPGRHRKRSPVRTVDEGSRPDELRNFMDPLPTAIDPLPRKAVARNLAGLPLGQIMLAHNAISRDKLEEALAAQIERGGRLGEVLVSLKACSEEQVLKALAAQLELPHQMPLGPEGVAP